MIWLREINGSLLTHVRTLMDNITDHYGNPVKPKVIIRKPDTDLESEQYPIITIYNLGFGEDIIHSDVNSFKQENKLNGTISKTPKAPKYRFRYQIDLWTESPIAMDSMTLAWIRNHPRKQSTIEIIDSKGGIHSCKFIQKDFRDLNFTDSKGRNIYRNAILYDILVSIEVSKSTVHLPVTKLSIINTNI